MLSKIDINKELGRGINIYPFNSDNIKENSINLSASEYAWSMKAGKVFVDQYGEIYNYNKNGNSKQFEIVKGRSAVREINGEKYIILLPVSTVLLETKEVLAINNYIGGTYHSKVGIVSLGIGHNGTMLGPNFCGHSLIAMHNVSEYPLKIKVGDTVVSVVFSYLESPIDFQNVTQNGHLEKMAQLGVKLNADETREINQDWKNKAIDIKEKMNTSEEFKAYKRTLSKRKFEAGLLYINGMNLFLIVTIIGVFLIGLNICKYVDAQNNNSIWSDRFWNVGCSGILVAILQSMWGVFKPKKQNR